MTMTSAGAFLRRERLARGLTLLETGEKLGISTTYVHDIECGKRPLILEWIEPFAKLFQLTDERKCDLYAHSGLLPSDVTNSLLRAPEVWGADFKKLYRAALRAESVLRANGFTKEATELQKAISRRE
jgi:transcriptional regulator with XRE-family HTH domain